MSSGLLELFGFRTSSGSRDPFTTLDREVALDYAQQNRLQMVVEYFHRIGDEALSDFRRENQPATDVLVDRR